MLVDDEPEQALAHARAARDRASRVAVVREAVGVAAYHAGDYAEAAREIRAYRRMSGDRGYRAVLADCERALGRPDIALRLIAEALADGPDAAERTELRLVEAGARRDLGEVAAARLVLEGELGGRPDPSRLDAGDPAALRVAGAYAELLAASGDDTAAARWAAAVAAATPEDDVEFAEMDLDDLEADGDQTGEPALRVDRTGSGAPPTEEPAAVAAAVDVPVAQQPSEPAEDEATAEQAPGAGHPVVHARDPIGEPEPEPVARTGVDGSDAGGVAETAAGTTDLQFSSGTPDHGPARPQDDDAFAGDFDAQVEAEVAELLGEDEESG
jgi:hypothetical protein